MYAFQPRIPVNYVVELIAILRGTQERERGEVLMLCGATLGEIGALVKGGLSFTMDDESDVDVDNEIAALEVTLSEPSSLSEPAVDLTPWIPVILKLIELIMKRRG